MVLKSNFFKFYIIFILLLLITINSAFALKASTRAEIDFKPNLVYEGALCIVPEATPLLKIQKQGELAEYIDIAVSDVDLSNGPWCYPYTVSLPGSFERPGRHTASLKVIENNPTEVGTISALVSVTHEIRVFVPYPGKYLETSFTASNAKEGEEVQFSATMTSKGTETVDEVKGTILIYNKAGEQVGEVKTDSFKDLKTSERATITATWDSKGNTVGDYNAVLKLDYDEKEDEFSTDFKLGSLEVILTDSTSTVYKKGIVPFNVYLESYWSEQIPDVKAKVSFMQNNVPIVEFETLTHTLKPWEEKGFQGFLDTSKLELGNYTPQVTVYYAEEKEEYTISVEVIKEPEPVIDKPEKPKEMDMTKVLLFTTIGFAVLAIILAMFILFGGKKKKSNPQEETNTNVNQQEPPKY